MSRSFIRILSVFSLIMTFNGFLARAQGGVPSQNSPSAEVQKDQGEVVKDKEQVRQDRQKLRADRQQLRQDRKKMHEDRKELHKAKHKK